MAPGFVADGYILHVDYSNGPANVAINIEKVKTNQNVMDKTPAAVIPNVLGERSYYAELEVVGAGPVTVTGRLYESKGGALLAQVSFVDTDAKDPWEDANKAEKVFTEGLCGIFAQNEQNDGEPAGFKCTWDDVSAVADFSREPSLVIDDFEGYADHAPIGGVWGRQHRGLRLRVPRRRSASQGYKALRRKSRTSSSPTRRRSPARSPRRGTGRRREPICSPSRSTDTMLIPRTKPRTSTAATRSSLCM